MAVKVQQTPHGDCLWHKASCMQDPLREYLAARGNTRCGWQVGRSQCVASVPTRNDQNGAIALRCSDQVIAAKT